MDYLRLENELPKTPERPGRSFVPALNGKRLEWENIVYYEFENVRAVRTDRWKYVERYRQSPNELYDLTDDPGERNNLDGQAQHAKTQLQLKSRLGQFFGQYRQEEWDLWNGGRSKTGLITSGLFSAENHSEQERTGAAK